MSFIVEALPASQRRALWELARTAPLARFYLGGGTAVALHLGHRRSQDLDWFTPESLDPLLLAEAIRGELARWETRLARAGTLHGTVSAVPVSFLEYRYPLLQPPLHWSEAGCDVASLDDLACMKLAAVAQRGSKKDFVDIYALGLRHIPLEGMLELYQRKYRIQDVAHLLYALAYFEDADRERMPRLRWNISWRTIKATIAGWVKEVAG